MHLHADHIISARRQQGDLLSIARDTVKMPPAIPVTDPGERFAVFQPFQVIVHVDPGVILFDKEGGNGAVEHIPKQQRVLILQAG